MMYDGYYISKYVYHDALLNAFFLTEIVLIDTYSEQICPYRPLSRIQYLMCAILKLHKILTKYIRC